MTPRLFWGHEAVTSDPTWPPACRCWQRNTKSSWKCAHIALAPSTKWCHLLDAHLPTPGKSSILAPRCDVWPTWNHYLYWPYPTLPCPSLPSPPLPSWVLSVTYKCVKCSHETLFFFYLSSASLYLSLELLRVGFTFFDLKTFLRCCDKCFWLLVCILIFFFKCTVFLYSFTEAYIFMVKVCLLLLFNILISDPKNITSFECTSSFITSYSPTTLLFFFRLYFIICTFIFIAYMFSGQDTLFAGHSTIHAIIRTTLREDLALVG